jgi:DNA-directed RNA polymerase subunit RPC12/RpoP
MLTCTCGARLVDDVDDEGVRVGDDEFRLARSTDYIACPECGDLHRIADLRARAAGGLSQTDEALEVLHDLARDEPDDDPTRIVGRVPPEA